MPEDNREAVQSRELEYTVISLVSEKTEILIVGGGKAGLLKCRSFCKRGCRLTVVSPKFTEGFEELSKKNNVTLIYDYYHIDYIFKKHLIIVAVDDSSLREEIVKDCEANYKLYLDCSDFRRSVFTAPYQSDTRDMLFSLQAKHANPRLSVFLGRKTKELLSEYDDFSKYACNVRNIIKKHSEKNQIMEFVCSEDFYFFFNKGLHESILKMFYGGIDFEFNNCNAKKQACSGADGNSNGDA